MTGKDISFMVVGAFLFFVFSEFFSSMWRNSKKDD